MAKGLSDNCWRSKGLIHISYSVWTPKNTFLRTISLLHGSLERFIFRGSGTRHFFLWRCDPTRVMAYSFLRFLDHTQRRTTVGRTPLDKWSARRRDLCLTTHNTHNRQISMPPVGFEPTISAVERPQTYDLDRAATGTSKTNTKNNYMC